MPEGLNSCNIFYYTDYGLTVKIVCRSGLTRKDYLIWFFFSKVINIFLGSVLPAFHLESSAVYVMIVYLLVLAAVVMFEIYLACKQGKSVREYCVLSKPQEDEFDLTPVSASGTEIDVEKVH